MMTTVRCQKAAQPRRIAELALSVAVLILPLCGCGQSRGSDNQVASEASGDPQASDYVVAPTVQTAVHTSDAMVTLTGRAAPDSIVRLSSPEGQSWGMTSGPDGAWSFTIPVSREPRMLALTAERAGRDVHAEGAVILLPAGALAGVVARAGYGALAVANPVARPVIVGLDFDGGGGAVASGMAKPGSTVRLFVDDEAAGSGKADAMGRFATPAVNRPLTLGAHRVQVQTPEGAADLQLLVKASAPLNGVYRATREDGAWRLDWRTPGGGQQSTLIFDSAQRALTGSAG